MDWNIRSRKNLEAYLIYLDKLCIIFSVGWFTAVARCRVFPVEIEAVEIMLTQELDGRSDQILTGLWVGYQFGEALGPFVPATDGQQSPQVLVVRLETVEFGITSY